MPLIPPVDPSTFWVLVGAVIGAAAAILGGIIGGIHMFGGCWHILYSSTDGLLSAKKDRRHTDKVAQDDSKSGLLTWQI